MTLALETTNCVFQCGRPWTVLGQRGGHNRQRSGAPAGAWWAGAATGED